LFVKDLIFIDPEDCVRVSDFIDLFGRKLHVVWHDDKLGSVLVDLKRGRSHMALVQKIGTNKKNEDADPYYEICGIITMEDIIEEILGEEIVDETDTYYDGSHSLRIERDIDKASQWSKLRLLDSRLVDEHLSTDESMAVVAHLQKNHAEVFPTSLLTENQLFKMIHDDTPVQTIQPVNESELMVGELPTDLLYEKGTPTDCCTLILSGKVTIIVGNENFKTEVSSWSLLGSGALFEVPTSVHAPGQIHQFYTPDFTAYVSGDSPCRCIQITSSKLSKAIDASTAERLLALPSSSRSNDDKSNETSFMNMSSSEDSCGDRKSHKYQRSGSRSFEENILLSAAAAAGLPMKKTADISLALANDSSGHGRDIFTRNVIETSCINDTLSNSCRFARCHKHRCN
jgi:hypothetical protein